jgi:hypothetical protein
MQVKLYIWGKKSFLDILNYEENALMTYGTYFENND